jgi:hypothetical protein
LGEKKVKRKQRKQKRMARGEHQRIDIHCSIRKDWSNQTANFRKPNIILILADDVGGILIMPHSLWFVN